MTEKKPRGPKRGHGEGGTPYKRSDGRWTAQVTYPDGRRVSVYGRTMKACQKARNDLILEIAGGETISPERITVAQFLARWQRASRAPVAATSAERYAQHMRHWTDLIGDKLLRDLTDLDIAEAEAKMLETLASSTVRVAHGILHAALKKAVSSRFLKQDPMAGMKRPAESYREMQTLSEEEVTRLIMGTQSDPYHALWVLLVTGGLRLREALGLTWGNVDFGDCRVVILGRLARRKAEGEEKKPAKTVRSRRAVHLPPETLAVLEAHRQRQLEILGKQELVFTTSTGAPVYGNRAYVSWKYTTKRLGLPDIRPHDLRHTYATLALQRGIHPKLVSEQLGHADVAMTLRIYAHVLPSFARDAAAVFSGLFPSDSGQNSSRSAGRASFALLPGAKSTAV